MMEDGECNDDEHEQAMASVDCADSLIHTGPHCTGGGDVAVGDDYDDGALESDISDESSLPEENPVSPDPEHETSINNSFILGISSKRLNSSRSADYSGDADENAYFEDDNDDRSCG